MSVKSNTTLAEVYDIPGPDGHSRIPYDDSTVASGSLDGDSLYKMSSNNDFHYLITEQGATEISVTQGHFVASGQQETFGTDAKRKTIQVQRSTTGGTVFLTKLLPRGT